MSRSGYHDDCNEWALIRWRGAVASAIRGARGQAMLRELVAALDALPEKRLAAESLVTSDGSYCALGALGRARGIDMTRIDPEDRRTVAATFGIAEALAAEIMYLNDEYAADLYEFEAVEICGPMRPGYPDFGRHIKNVCVRNRRADFDRWVSMREWAAANVKAEK